MAPFGTSVDVTPGRTLRAELASVFRTEERKMTASSRPCSMTDPRPPDRAVKVQAVRGKLDDCFTYRNRSSGR